ncbi:hypothetical protein ACIOEX_30865, partial [Streptomyces sp. NPDC087850]|uniref:hypothetical protein n=1 Tax=Streptomyces sp. NPDC087850 TaxID=3365809 RepID=UPI00381E5CA4
MGQFHLGPVTLTLEGVGGERCERSATEQLTPWDVRAGDVEVGQGGKERGRLVPVLPQERHGGNVRPENTTD